MGEGSLMHPLAGKKQSQEHIAKRVAAMRASGATARHAQRLAASNQDPEVNARRVATRRAKGNYSGKHFVALNKSRAGKPLTESVKRKISIALGRHVAATTGGAYYRAGVPQPESVCKKRSAYWRANPEKHNHYIDGKSAERHGARLIDMSRREYRSWRRKVLSRDKRICQGCGTVGGRLHADHILPYAKYPAHRYDVTNGRTLCPPCHRKTPTYGGRKLEKVCEFDLIAA